MSYEVRVVTSSNEERDFIDLPWDLHGSDENWVPPLKIAVKDVLNPKKNPFFKHAEFSKWVAYKDGKRVGRIAGFIDKNHNDFHQEKTAHFGFFETINDQNIANALLKAASDWAKAKGSETLRGPMNPSTNHECGMQISAFDTKPFIMMTQNPEYYPKLMDGAGFVKAKDLYAWLVSGDCKFDDKLVKRAKALEHAEHITFRHINMKDYDAEIERILQVYNDAWEKNWEFVPMTDDEFRHMAKEMRPVVIPELLYIVEVRGEIAAFSLFLPDVNQIFSKIRDGKLFPTGLLKLLYYTKVKKIMNRGRMLTLGVRKKFQSLGLAPLMYMRYLTEGPANGFPVCECSWVLEDNKPMNGGLKLMNATMYKTYRIYDKKLN